MDVVEEIEEFDTNAFFDLSTTENPNFIETSIYSKDKEILGQALRILSQKPDINELKRLSFCKVVLESCLEMQKKMSTIIIDNECVLDFGNEPERVVLLKKRKN